MDRPIDFRQLPLPMPATRRPRDVDAAISELLARQFDTVGTRQLRAMGVDRDAVRRRVHSSRLHLADVGRGVYTSTPRLLTGPSRHFAALLWAPDSAGLANTSAASIQDLEREHGSDVHVLVIGDSRRSAPGIKLHRAPRVPAVDWSITDGLRHTATARTILDVAFRGEQQRIDRLVDRAVALRLYDHEAMDRVRADRPTVPGVGRLTAAIEKLDENSGLQKSEFERLTTALIQTAGDLPTPVVNALLEGYEPDLRFPGTRGIIELDSRDYHRSPAQIARDIAKQRALEALGYVFLRLRWEQIVYYPEQGLERLRAFYAANAVPPVPR